MHDDTAESGTATSNDHAAPRKALVIAGAVIALAIGSVAFIVQSGTSRSERIDYAAASVANLASSAAADASGANTGAAAGSPTVPHFQRTDEPAYTDTMNPHGG